MQMREGMTQMHERVQMHEHAQTNAAHVRTLREARATEATLRAKGVRRSSPTNWLSCECVRLAKMTCAIGTQ